MLAATPRAKPPSGKGQPKRDRRIRNVTDGETPTLAALGISKRESAEAGRTGAGAVAGAVGVAVVLALTLAVAVAGAPGRVFLADHESPRGRTALRAERTQKYLSES